MITTSTIAMLSRVITDAYAPIADAIIAQESPFLGLATRRRVFTKADEYRDPEDTLRAQRLRAVMPFGETIKEMRGDDGCPCCGDY